MFPEYFSGTVEIRTLSGRRLNHYQQYNIGSDVIPISAQNVVEKFNDNARTAVSERRAKRIRKAIMGLDMADDLSELDCAICRTSD